MECRPRRTECAERKRGARSGEQGAGISDSQLLAPCSLLKELSMPFAFIPTVLGICFCLIWFLIGGMAFRDGQLAAQQDRETEFSVLALPAKVRRRKAA